jgi:hypothetical protein
MNHDQIEDVEEMVVVISRVEVEPFHFRNIVGT